MEPSEVPRLLLKIDNGPRTAHLTRAQKADLFYETVSQKHFGSRVTPGQLPEELEREVAAALDAFTLPSNEIDLMMEEGPKRAKVRCGRRVSTDKHRHEKQEVLHGLYAQREAHLRRFGMETEGPIKSYRQRTSSWYEAQNAHLETMAGELAESLKAEAAHLDVELVELPPTGGSFMSTVNHIQAWTTALLGPMTVRLDELRGKANIPRLVEKTGYQAPIGTPPYSYRAAHHRLLMLTRAMVKHAEEAMNHVNRLPAGYGPMGPKEDWSWFELDALLTGLEEIPLTGADVIQELDV